MITDTTTVVTREQITDAARTYQQHASVGEFNVTKALHLADVLAALVFAYDEQQNDALIALHRGNKRRAEEQLARLGVEP